jgi:uncharacterized small protein (TIGR04563 family)
MRAHVKPVAARPPLEPSNSHRVCVAIPAALLEQAKREASRLDRSLSWIFQQAWRLARERVSELPAADLRIVRTPPSRPGRTGSRRV